MYGTVSLGWAASSLLRGSQWPAAPVRFIQRSPSHSCSANVWQEAKPFDYNATPSFTLGLSDITQKLDLDLDINAGGQVESHEHVDRLGIGIQNIDQAVVCADFKMLM